MTRQEQIKYIGNNSVISQYNDKLNFLSYFIIPLPQRFYERGISADELEKSGWRILNNENRSLDPLNEIKKYIYESMIPSVDLKKLQKFKPNLLLRKELDNKEYFINTQTDGKKIKILISEIDVWILDANIAFFVLKFELPVENKISLNEISCMVNRNLRDFRDLMVENNNIRVKYQKEVSNFIDWIFELTKTGEKTFLNIEKNDFERYEFYPIYNSSYYAKMLTAVHVDIDEEILKKIESDYEEELKTIEIDGTGVIEEVPFLLATTSEFYPQKLWEANESYINETVSKGGINIWKYWSGLAVKDSLAFFSINEGGGMIVSACRSVNYFIYILNLYVNYRVKLLEHMLIENKDFIDIESDLKKLEEVQKLHNMFMSEEIAVKFQPNEIHKSIMKGLETKELFDEVEDNINKTYQRTKDNTDILVGIGMGFVGIAGTFLSKEWLVKTFNEHPFVFSSVSICLMAAMFAMIIKRKLIYKKIAEFKKNISIK